PPARGLLRLPGGARGVGRAQRVPPEVALFPKHAVELGDPNILICCVSKFWPPVLRLRWLRNGIPEFQGVLDMPFYPDRDNTFRKFSYLPFIPQPGDYYDCQVEHEGLAEPNFFGDFSEMFWGFFGNFLAHFWDFLGGFFLG
uniref:Ig-like domain-containing protein n=1 Tax=Cyanistes caeruleus TaxID=156563 RepID=A0A8C0U4L8_CYACU